MSTLGLDSPLVEQLRREVEARWDTPFSFRVNPRNGVVVVRWMNGPVTADIRSLVDALEHASPEEPLKWLFDRNPSYTAWAILRGPGMPATTEVPWTREQIRNDLRDPHERIRFGEIYTEHFRDVDLCDLAALAGSPEVLAQAEIAAGLGTEVGPQRWDYFDHWLRHGGWALAGMLLVDSPF